MLTVTQTNQQVREKLEKDLKLFFGKGGQVRHLPPCTYSDHILTEKQRFDARFGQRGKK